MTKLKLEYFETKLKSASAKRKIKTQSNIFSSLEFDFFRVQLKLSIRIRQLVTNTVLNITY